MLARETVRAFERSHSQSVALANSEVIASPNDGDASVGRTYSTGHSFVTEEELAAIETSKLEISGGWYFIHDVWRDVLGSSQFVWV